MRSVRVPIAVLVACILALAASSARSGVPFPAPATPTGVDSTGGTRTGVAPPQWPTGTITLRFENLEGAILLSAKLHGPTGRDTTGLLVLDTGAGYLALDGDLAVALGLADSSSAASQPAFASGVLSRLDIGAMSLDQVAPILMIETDVVRRAVDREALGLLGHLPVNARALQIDYRDSALAIVPAPPPPQDHDPVAVSRRLLSATLTPAAIPVAFKLLGDGKLVVAARVSDSIRSRFSPWLNLIVDTGATKSVLFEPNLSTMFPHSRKWSALRGLTAPTLTGDAEARIARIPTIEVMGVGGTAHQADVDAALIQSPLAEALSRVTGMPIHGLLGYSFLRRYRITVDYPDRVLWLDPVAVGRDERVNEYSTVGVQLERSDGAVRVAAVAAGSPAARAHVARGDEVLAVGGVRVSGLDLGAIARKLEGPPGSPVALYLRRGNSTRELKLFRRRLL